METATDMNIDTQPSVEELSKKNEEETTEQETPTGENDTTEE